MKSKFFIILLVFLLTLSLVGCKKPNNNSTSNPSQQNSNSTINSTQQGSEIELAYVEGGDNSISLGIKEEVNTTYKVKYFIDDIPYVLDSQLMKKENDIIVCEILGLKAGLNKVEITSKNGEKLGYKTINDILVNELDRSGYAHFGSSEGIGAYNNDGTLKDNAMVLYLSNENKNTIELVHNNIRYVGIVKILGMLSSIKVPVNIRILDMVKTNQWKYKNVEPRLADDSNYNADFFKNEFETTYGENIVGLYCNLKDARDGINYKYVTTKDSIVFSKQSTSSQSTTTYKRNDFPHLNGKTTYGDDCSNNLAQVTNGKNITIEGVFENSGLFQWGISFSKCNSIEVRNLVFDSYTEDAVNFTGDSGSSGPSSSSQNYPYQGFFVHHNTFTRGKNNWDITGERDKYAGDGTIDLNETSNVTICYNDIRNTKKTILISSSDTNKTRNVTLHHNYFYGGESRLPFSRHTNIHTYNNYYHNVSEGARMQANAYLFSENNYYYNCSKPAITKTAFTGDKAAIKSYNDFFYNCNTVLVTKVTSRDEVVPNGCDTSLDYDYSTFDTNKEIFYYDEVNKKSKVTLMHETSDVPTAVLSLCGAKKRPS